MKALIVLAALGAGAWYLFGNPKGWPDVVKLERERLPAQLREALQAGKDAAARREREIVDELAGALGNQPGGGI